MRSYALQLRAIPVLNAIAEVPSRRDLPSEVLMLVSFSDVRAAADPEPSPQADLLPAAANAPVTARRRIDR